MTLFRFSIHILNLPAVFKHLFAGFKHFFGQNPMQLSYNVNAINKEIQIVTLICNYQVVD